MHAIQGSITETVPKQVLRVRQSLGYCSPYSTNFKHPLSILRYATTYRKVLQRKRKIQSFMYELERQNI